MVERNDGEGGGGDDHGGVGEDSSLLRVSDCPARLPNRYASDGVVAVHSVISSADHTCPADHQRGDGPIAAGY